ncbi:hypothetical protein KKG05_01610, partial [bacterium]|nr:hypothetical protein [bacterium]
MFLRYSLLTVFFLVMMNPLLAQNVRLQTYPIPPTRDIARSYIFSGNETSFFFGTTAALRQNPFMGLTVAGEKLFDDVRLWHGDKLFDRSKAQTDFWGQGVSFTSDSITLVLDMARRDFVRVIGLSEAPQDLSLELVFAPGVLGERNVKNYPDALTISPPPNGEIFLAVAWLSDEILQGRMEQISYLLPDSMYSFSPFYGQQRFHVLAPNWTIAYGVSEDDALASARQLLTDRGSSSLARRNALRHSLSPSEFDATNTSVTDALRWAKKSLLDLQAADGSE